MVRSFIAGMLEMLRRIQWNFCGSRSLWNNLNMSWLKYADRLENEHLGNVDQYRVTREVPLPYALDSSRDNDEDDDDDDRQMWKYFT